MTACDSEVAESNTYRQEVHGLYADLSFGISEKDREKVNPRLLLLTPILRTFGWSRGLESVRWVRGGVLCGSWDRGHVNETQIQ